MGCFINPGNLRERITINFPASSSIDRYGQSIMSWTSGSYWASIKQQTGTEVNVRGVIGSNATYIFTVRDNDAINEKCTIDYEGNSYNIVFMEEPDKFVSYLNLTGERRN